MMRADYLAADFNADEASQTVTGTTYDRADDSNFGLDLGYVSPNLVKGKAFDVQGAVSVRNVISPKFNLQTTGQDDLGNTVALDGSFKQQMQVDVGARAASRLYRTAGFVEVHNLTKKNGGDTTFHIGAEYVPMKIVALRAGFDDSKLTAGLGLKFAGARLDLAVSQKPQERFALGLTYGR